MAQTTIQNLNAIRTGSVKFEYGSDFGSLVDAGAINNFVWTHGGETVEIELDNVDNIRKLKNNDQYSITFDMAETSFDNLAGLFSGNFTTTNIAGSLVSGAAQTVASGNWSFDKFIEIENQNGDGSAITINSVTLGTDGALVADTDYFVIKNAQNKYGIYIIDSATVTTEAQDVVINYDYTPNASVRMTPQTGGIAPTYVVQFTNTDDDGNAFTIRMENVSSVNQLSLPFPGDGTDDVAQISVELEGKLVYADDTQAI